MLSFTMLQAVDNNYFNLGLHLKTEAKKLKVLGYFGCVGTGLEFSQQKVIDFVKEYITGRVLNSPTGQVLEEGSDWPALVDADDRTRLTNLGGPVRFRLVPDQSL